MEEVLLLYYHRINDLNNDFNLLCVNQENFRQQMLFLKNNYEIFRFEDEWKSDKKGIVITFDDGYLDNLENALPILEELNIPAIFFVTAGYFNNEKIFWWDELEEILLVGDKFAPKFQLVDDVYGCEWKTDTWSHRINCYKALHFLIKNCVDIKKRENWMRQLWIWKGNDRSNVDKYKILSEEQLKKMLASKVVTIGAHTLTHPTLARLKYDEQEREIIESIERLEKITDKKIEYFSYPFGGRETDYNSDTLNICQKIGIKKAVSTNPGLWEKTCNSLEIPRNCVKNWSVNEFENRINQIWEKY